MYNNLQRRGVRTSQTINPQSLEQDLNEQVRIISPDSGQFYWMLDKLTRGPRPISHKVEQTQYYEFDHFDLVTETAPGVVVAANLARYARLSVAQISRPTTGGSMYYWPQDVFKLPSGQTAMVVMTPDAALVINGAEITLNATLTGNSTSRSAAGTVVVRVMDAVPFIDFGAGDIICLGRTIHESQYIDPPSSQRDVMYDYNFVEHKEKYIQFSEDAKDLVKSKGNLEFDKQQKMMIAELRREWDYNLIHGVRTIQYDENNRPTRTMDGLINVIRTNVAAYNPDSTDDMELLISEWMRTGIFRYDINGRTSILVLAGSRFMSRFQYAFRDQRRSDLDKKKYTPGFNITTYDFMGHSISLLNYNGFRQGTMYEDWALAVDMKEPVYRPVKQFETKMIGDSRDRDIAVMVEVQGSVEWHREQAYALLRTP